MPEHGSNMFIFVFQRYIFYVNKGDHGFDNEDMDMKHIFRAFGPDFKKGYVAEPFDSIHIYPLMCKLLGVQPELNNGSLAFTRDMLQNQNSNFIFPMILSIALLVILLIVVSVVIYLCVRQKR